MEGKLEGVKVDVVRPVRRDNGDPAQAQAGNKEKQSDIKEVKSTALAR